MPKATATQETFRKELKTLPEGFVVLRKMNYGQRLRQRDIAMAMSREEDGSMKMEMNSEESTVFEFKASIVDHNLEDDDGRKLDLASPNDIMKLDPKVAGEIENYLNELNQPEELGEGQEGFPTVSSRQLKAVKQQTKK